VVRASDLGDDWRPEAHMPVVGEPHPCDNCGTVYDETSGEGYCGLCPSCADAGESV
jgi:hypothetical protein